MEVREKIKNRLTATFDQKKNNLLNIYFTAGFPALEDTGVILKALEKAGADIVEIGMPFSDPMADGPTIQESGDQALSNGMSLKKLFAQLKDIRKEVKIPILLMGYLNTVMQYGIENFIKKAAEVGVDGVILPDLPVAEYQEIYRDVFEAHNLSFIFLVTPQTSAERLKQIDENASGFIYVVSTDSTTGNTKSVKDSEAFLTRIKDAKLKNPTLVGFNIKDNETFRFANTYANGAIIGSAFIKMLKNSKNLESDIVKFVSEIKG
jgi:tryptophan synthase alpha chain